MMAPVAMRKLFFNIHILIYGFYLLAAIIVTLPLISVFDTRLAGHPFGDSYELVRHMWWMQHALQTGQPVFSQPLLAYPDGMDGSLLWSYPLQSFPAWLFSFIMPLPAAFNLSILLRLALNGWAACFLAHYLTRHRPASLVAGIIFLSYPTFQTHLAAGHTGLLALYPIPLYVWALLRLRETGRLHWIGIAALFFVASQWGSTQLLIMTLFPITLLFAFALLVRRDWAALRNTLITVLTGGIASLIFALPLLLSTLDTPAYAQPTTGVVDYSTDLFGVIAPSFYHPLFRANALSVSVIGVDPFEGTAYVGVIAALLGSIGLIYHREARWWGLLGITAWIFSLGVLLKMFYNAVPVVIDHFATYITLPWTALYNLPLINITRTPGRFHFTVALAVAIMAAYGIAYLWRKRWLRSLYPIVLLLIVFEYQFFWTINRAGLPVPALPTLPGIVPEPIADLAERDDIRAVFDLPWNHLLAAKQGLWLQTGHQQPLLAGHVTRQTTVNPAKLALLQATLDPALLDHAGVDIIILHKEWDDPAGETDSFTRAALGDPFYEDDQYAAFEIPASAANTTFIALPADADRLTDQVDSYVYAPAAGTAQLRFSLRATDVGGRRVALYQNERFIARWTINDTLQLDLPLRFEVEGYYLLTLALDPPCLQYHHDTLECRDVQIEQLEIDGYSAETTQGTE
jgi:hypothetical protein